MQSDIILTTLNSSYAHSSFALRYLMANLKEYQTRAQIIEFTIAKDPRDIAEALLKENPKIIGIGVYIWNATESLELVSLLKKIRPEVMIVLGGPEVSHESEGQRICQLADFVIKGEGDFLFYEFCRDFFAHQQTPAHKFISGALPDIKTIASPYSLYTDEDIKNRVIYVEISRGCPYRCEYCLSSLDKAVRSFDLDLFLKDMESLIERGARQFKFIDRTFNLSATTCTRVLQFFLDRMDKGLFLHFEMVPDRLPTEIRDLIKLFPKGSLQFEIGIQTWNVEVARLVSRRNDLEKVKENFRFLAEETGVHSHADLIVGLPGEDLQSFSQGFDILSSLRPDEIQVGILKRLKGAPIARHDKEWEMVYHDHPPFQILRNKNLNYETLQIMNRFAKFWDLYANSGNFQNFMALIKHRANQREVPSLFWEFYDFNSFLSARHAQSFGISLLSLVESAYIYLTAELKMEESAAKEILLKDYIIPGKRDVPRFLRTENTVRSKTLHDSSSTQASLPKRQQRHLVADSKTTIQQSS